MKSRLLIVGVDTVFRENLAQHMRAEKYKVYLSHQDSEIKRLIKRNDIEVVLLSLLELKQEGLKILKMIKKHRPSLEVILINHSDSMALSIEGMKLGALDDFFLPLDMKVLLSKIEEAVSRYRQSKKARKPLMQRYEEMMIAISLAEAGSPDLAHEYLNRDDRGSQKKEKIKKT